jgi:hypothetical protein
MRRTSLNGLIDATRCAARIAKAELKDLLFDNSTSFFSHQT